ncbi:MAG: class C sortase [Erysipelotrichaceae bacterium]|nr:class C sortase [Erysipelotrichaceae bacterium]
MNKTKNITAPNWLKKNWGNLALACLFIVGILIFLYPTIANYWNTYNSGKAIMSYSEAVSQMSKEDYDRELKKANDYNLQLAQNGIDWKPKEDLSEYSSILNLTGDGIMGYIKIDKLKVSLPIYHTAEEAVLQVGVGHLESTSLPVGTISYDTKTSKVTDPNEGSHCVLTGHRGLPSAKLFSDLDKLTEGDVFSIYVLGETYTYQVDQIRVVLPSDVEELNITPGEDYCTLVTCTPYGINTHRLLVRGKRVNNIQGDVDVVPDATLIESEYVAPFIAAPIIVVIVLIVLFKKPKKKGEEE